MEDGKFINSIIVDTPIGLITVRNTAEFEDGDSLICNIKYHGDHQCEWVIQLDKNGKEIQRFNIKYIVNINWL